jgi:hypothetical protein
MHLNIDRNCAERERKREAQCLLTRKEKVTIVTLSLCVSVREGEWSGCGPSLCGLEGQAIKFCSTECAERWGFHPLSIFGSNAK